MALVDIAFQKELSWDYDECVLRTFRVEGKCHLPNEECPLPCSSSQRQQFVVNIMACNVEDVCKKLRESDFIRPIKSILVFNKPVLSGEVIPSSPLFDEELDPNCFIDITPSPQNCVECCDFLLDENPVDTIGGYGVISYHFNANASGGMQLSSNTTSELHLQLNASGQMTIRGDADVFSVRYYWSGSGGMIISSSSVEKSSRYLCGGSGTMHITSTASGISSRYLYAGSGTMVLGSQSDTDFHLASQGSGLMIIGSRTSVRNNGYHYGFAGSGLMRINGNVVAKCSRYLCATSGTMIISSSVGTNRYYCAGSGRMTLSNRLKLSFRNTSTGLMGISGLVVPHWNAGYTGSGSMTMSGSFVAISSAFYYSGSGLMTFASNAFTQGSDLGILDELTGTDTDISDLSAVFATVEAPPITLTITDVVLPSCCSGPIPSLLQFRHNLSGIQGLNRFLLRNGLTLLGDLGSNTYIPMQYRPRSAVWQGNLHLDGLSVINEGQSSWDFAFEFGCTDEVSGSFLGANVWRFAAFIRNKEYATNQTFVVRYVSTWSLATICQTGKQFDRFDFNFNFRNRVSVPSAASPVVFHDEAAILATSPLFKDKPELKFRISVGDQERRQTFDHSLDNQRNAASAVADASGHPL